MASSSNSTSANAIRLKRLDSIVKFIKETQPSSLNLEGMYISVEDLKSLISYLPDSQVTELILSDNDLENGMKELSKVLPKTEIRKLNVSSCDLSTQDFFLVVEAMNNTKVTELSIGGNNMDAFEVEERDRLLSFMLTSNLKIFDFSHCVTYIETDAHFFQALPNTLISRVSMCNGPSPEALIPLFSSLRQSSLTEITIVNNDELDSDVITKLSLNLIGSKIEILTLRLCNIDDRELDILVEGLVHSKVDNLNLGLNKIQGGNTLGVRLKDTHIKRLNLSGNRLDQYAMFVYPDFLRCSLVTDLDVSDCQLDAEHFRRIMESVKFSKVTNLNVAFNKLQLPSIAKLAEVVKDTSLKKVNLGGNSFCPESFIILAESIKTSKISHLDMFRCLKHPNGGNLLPVFLREVKDSSIDSLVFRWNELREIGAKILAPHLINITLTHLDLAWNKIGNGVISLAKNLKFSPLTHLNLNGNGISDEGVEALSENLPGTQLIELTLSSNKITSHGAKALSLYLKDCSLLYLDLSLNTIGKDGVETLSKGIENTFITVLNVSANLDPGDNFLLLDAALWENKTAVYYLTSTFKQIMPQTFRDSFHFDINTSNQSVEAFLENCLQLNMNILQKPSAIKVLKEDKMVSFRKEEIVHLMSEDFPKQFSEFMGSRVEADTTQQVAILKSAEEKGLSEVVECLLLNRPSYLIEESLGILHPYVYKLLNKYNHPLFNADVEPDAKTKLINYFTERRDLEGATDVIRLLHGKRKQ